MIRRWEVVWLSIILFGCTNRSQRSSPSTVDNVIQRENRLEGEFDWASGIDPDAQQLSAFADRAWTRAGTTVNLKVSAEADAAASWVLYRLGWYSGAGARRIATGDSFPIHQQPSCAMQADTGMVHCEWPTSAEVFIPPEVVTGLYVIKILRNNEFVRFVPLVIVDDRRADFVIQANINTWQAYNTWGGASLYTDQTGTLPLGRAVKVSFDRPYAMGRGAGHMFDWEAPFARFVESIGYDVTYTANSVIHAFGAGHLQRVHGVLFAGHDEYWTGEQRDAVELANQNGTALLFFGANQAYWKVRYEDAFDPSNPRVLTCYRVASLDPLQGRDVTVHFRDPQVNRPENALLGIMYESIVPLAFPWVVGNAESWIYEGTGLRAGDVIPALVGYEYDRRFDNGRTPAGLSVFARSPVALVYGSLPSWSEAATYRVPGAGRVFAVGTLLWTRALDPTSAFVNPAVQRMSANMLADVSGTPSPSPVGGPQARLPAPRGRPAQAVETVAAGFRAPAAVGLMPNGDILVADPLQHKLLAVGADAPHAVTVFAGDGKASNDPAFDNVPALFARFNSPGGIAVDATGIAYVADTFNHCIRKIDTDTQRTVSTLAGSIGKEGMVDGAASLARFRYPTGLALTADQSLIVADMFNHRVRRIEIGSGQVSTVAGSSVGDRDGPGNVAQFSYPSAVAVDNKGVIYVVSTHAAKVKAIMPDQEHSVMSIAGTIQGYADGPAFSSRIGAQGGIISNAGELLVSDAANLRVRQITLDAADASNSTIETLAGSGRFGNVDGMGSQAEFGLPLGLAVAADGTIYVADAANGTIRRIHR